MKSLQFLQAFSPAWPHHEQAGREQKWSLISNRGVWQPKKGRQTVYTLVTNSPKPGPLLITGKARERPVEPVTRDQGLWADPCHIWAEAPLWTQLGTAELDTE